MTSPRRDDRYEAPIDRLRHGRGDTRRALAVLVSIVAVLASALVLARLSGDDAAGPGGGSRSPRPAAVASTAATAAAPSLPATPRSAADRVERLIDAPNVALPGAPTVTLLERDAADGDGLLVRSWTPGADVVTLGTVRGVFGDDSPAIPVASPDHRRILLLALGG